MPNLIINGGTITQTVAGGNTGQRSIVLKTKDTYVLEDIQVDVAATATQGTFANSVPAADEDSYTPNNSPNTVIPAGGSLYLSGGWYPKQKIELGHLIPDIAENDAGTDQILYGYSAFDEDGNQITGTITTITPQFDGGDVSTTATLHYTAPSAILSPEGRFVPGNGADQLGDEYGITDQQPSSGTEGIDFLHVGVKIGSVSNGSAYATSTANRTAVLYNGSVHNFVDESDNTVALSAPSTNATNQSTRQNIDINSIINNSFGKYWIPIVTPQGRGADVSKTGQSGTVTCTLDNVTLASSGKFTDVDTGGVGANYGVHLFNPTTQNPNPSGDDGTDYLKIQTSGSGGNATVSGTINVAYSRSAVNSDATYKGLVSMNTNTQLLSSTTGTLEANVSTTSTPTITGGSYYYIDIVEPKGSEPSITATGISDTLAFSSTGAPSVRSYIKGTITPGNDTTFLGDEYGVTLTRPSGTDGINFLTIEPASSRTSGTLSGNATISFTRGAVNAKATYKGAVSMTTSTELVAEARGQTVTRKLSKTITPDTTLGENLYIPISRPAPSGGDLMGDSSITITTGSPDSISSGVTPDVNLYSKSGNNPQGTTPVDSTYGVQTTVPTSGNWVVLDPSAAVDAVDISAKINIVRSEITVSGNAGLWNGTGDSIGATSNTYTGTSSVAIPVNGGTSKYIPVVSPSANQPTFSSVTNPTVTTTTSATKKVGSASPTTAPSGVVTSTTAPSDLTSYSAGYIIVSPGSSSSSNGSIRASATASINPGITRGGTSSASSSTYSTISATVNNDNGAKTYIKIYDGSYNLL